MRKVLAFPIPPDVVLLGIFAAVWVIFLATHAGVRAQTPSSPGVISKLGTTGVRVLAGKLSCDISVQLASTMAGTKGQIQSVVHCWPPYESDINVIVPDLITDKHLHIGTDDIKISIRPASPNISWQVTANGVYQAGVL